MTRRPELDEHLEGTAYDKRLDGWGAEWTWYKGGNSEPVRLPAEGNPAKGIVIGCLVSLPCWIALFWWLEHC